MTRVRLDLKERTAHRFLHLAGQIMQCLAGMYAPRYGLTIATWKALSVIGAYGPMSGTELGKYTSLEPDKVTRTVDKLVARDLVLRRQDPADRRRVILTLSSKGKRINDVIEEVRRAIEIDFLRNLDDRELEMLYAILDKLDQRANEIFADEDAWRRILARCEAIDAMSSAGEQRIVRKRVTRLRLSGRKADV